MNSRDAILGKLRAARQGMPDGAAEEERLPMVPLADRSAGGLMHTFIAQAERLAGVVHRAATDHAAVEAIVKLVGKDPSVLCWDMEHVGVAGLREALAARGVEIAQPRDASARVGITGVDAALAATGSLVIASGVGKHRVTSLLPPVHIAVVRADQIVADLETWVADQRARGLAALRDTASVILISGPSRTADIAMQLTMGMHGPAELHIVLLG